MLKEFEDAVRGMKAGESKTFPLAFPADYHGKDVAGKTADFLVTVKKIEAANLPEVDEAFAKALGVAEGTVEGLRADIKKNLEREVKFRVQGRNKQAVMDDRKSTRLNSSHLVISYAVFCLKKKKLR